MEIVHAFQTLVPRIYKYIKSLVSQQQNGKKKEKKKIGQKVGVTSSEHSKMVSKCMQKLFNLTNTNN